MKADFFRLSIPYLWLGLWLVWLVGALTVKRSVQRQSLGSRLVQNPPIIAGFVLLFARDRWPPSLHQRILPQSAAVEWLGWALTAVGLGFAIWARLCIGSNWSGNVTIKEHHELIQGGPYRIVRHPIYTGFLLAFLGTAIVYGEVHGFIGFLLALLGFGLKLRLEEAFMIQQFGNIYLDYKRRVKAVVPFVV
jgi:protein-S-isoprenylcysteine O-methyltransferase Ste14